MIEDNKNIEPNQLSEKQNTYELINDEINNNDLNNIDISPYTNYNIKTQNNKLEERKENYLPIAYFLKFLKL